jgi:twinkle protein
VSIPNGVNSAKKALASNLEYLSNFEEVILMFDMDDPGREAAQSCAEILPNKAYIANLPYKDPNECLKNGESGAIISAIWTAQLYRPDDIVYVEDVKEELSKPIENGLPWFLPTLTEATFGRRFGEIYGLGAGTGVGKTDVLTQQIAYDIGVLNEKVGTIFLEQKPKETVSRIAGKLAHKRFHIPDGTWSQDELNEAVDMLNGKVVMLDSFGQTDWKVVQNKIRFMVESENIRIVYLDHLTAMAEAGNEKDSLEAIMKELAMLANSLNIIITFVSHLATPEGVPHEEGGRVAIRHFKGSRSIGFWSHFMFGLERNQQHEDEGKRSITTLRVLKDRHTGNSTGLTISLFYDRETGLLSEGDYDESTEGF